MPRKWGVLKAARKVLWTKAPEPEKSKPSVHWDTVETPSTSATAQGTDSAMVRTSGLPCSMLHACGLSLAARPQLAALACTWMCSSLGSACRHIATATGAWLFWQPAQRVEQGCNSFHPDGLTAGRAVHCAGLTL